MATVKALLEASALRTLETGTYRFCPQLACTTVYYNEQTRQRFAAAELRVRIWQKEAPGGRMICYCFDENERDMCAEVDRDGRSRAADRVRAHIAAGRCACHIRNPRGTCCLSDIMAAAARLNTRPDDTGTT